MPFTVVRNDITKMRVDAIVNTANPMPVIGAGTDARIHEAAGPALLDARQEIGPIARGDAAVTPAFNLAAKYVIHTVGPLWQDGSSGEEALLRSCYRRSLALALERGCTSVAFPLISTGNYGFPKDKALQIATAVFREFLLQYDLQIYLVVYDGESYRLSEQLFHNIACYIEEHTADYRPLRRMAAREAWEKDEAFCTREQMMPAPCAAPPKAKAAASLKEYLKRKDAGFTQTLLRLIDESGQKDSAVYKKANLSKQHFSKIRNNPDYKPTKPTAVALALALELDLAQTKDLIGRAGYALSDSSTFDLIIRFFLEQGHYNVIDVNIALYEFDQPLLGG